MVDRRYRATVSTTLIRILLKHIEKFGIEHIDICEAAGIDLSTLENSGERIPAKQFRYVWEEAIQRAGNQNFGLHFGKEIAYNYPGGHILFNVMMNCPTVRDATERFIRYNNLMADAIQPKMELHDDHVYLSLDIFKKDLKIPRHIAEALLSSYIHIFRHLTENKLNLVEVHFKHIQPMDISEHERIFKAPLLFEQPRNELVIDSKFLELPILLASQELLETLENFARRLLDRLYTSNPLSDKVIRLLSNLLARGEKLGIEIVAKEVGMSVRNLQIKLKQEGENYQKLLDAVRKDIALNYLNEKEATICDIAFLLGFSEQSAFNHAFKRWTGTTPREYFKKKNIS